MTLLRAAQVVDHAAPLFRYVMRAVDPHAVHTLQETRYECVVIGGLTWHRDHDGHAAPGRAQTEHGFGMCFEQTVTLCKIDPARCLDRNASPLRPRQAP